MKWFEGGIPQAIQAAKNNNSVFIVFVTGEDDKSTEMESTLNSAPVSEVCEQNRCVAIKILGNSNECKFFSQIYPVVVIPSTFFIGNTGVPLEVIGEVTSRQEFLDKVKHAIEMQKSSSGPPQTPSSPPTSPQSASSSSHCAEEEMVMQGATAAPQDAAPRESDTGSGDDVAVSAEKKAKVSEGLDSRVEKAKQLVEAKREEKQQKEAEEERSKELERRTMGQGVQKLRQNQKERDLMESKMELKKDREEDKLARQRVKEQIARDRAERAARFNREKEEREQGREEARKRKLLEEQASQQEEVARRSEIARIQFRRPDGSSINHQFSATATFSEVHAFITQEMQSSSLTLSTTFPRRTFTQDDHCLTLQELQLAPSAAILVIPGGMSTSGVRGSNDSLSLSSLTGYLLAPLYFFWNILSSLLAGFTGGGGAQGSSDQSSSGGGGGQRGGAVRRGPLASGGDRNMGSVRQRPQAGSYQEGAIHRFHNAQDDQDPDDTSTWNGNSTQQM